MSITAMWPAISGPVRPQRQPYLPCCPEARMDFVAVRLREDGFYRRILPEVRNETVASRSGERQRFLSFD